MKEFKKPAKLWFGSNPSIVPGTSSWVEQNPAIRVPFEDWGFTISGADHLYDNPWIHSEAFAKAYRAGVAKRVDGEKIVAGLLNPVEIRLDPCGAVLAGLL